MSKYIVSKYIVLKYIVSKYIVSKYIVSKYIVSKYIVSKQKVSDFIRLGKHCQLNTKLNIYKMFMYMCWRGEEVSHICIFFFFFFCFFLNFHHYTVLNWFSLFTATFICDDTQSTMGKELTMARQELGIFHCLQQE